MSCASKSHNLLFLEFIKCSFTSHSLPIYYDSDGAGRTGTFICIHAQLERMKTEGVVDFFQFIKSGRMHRAGLVSDVVSSAIINHARFVHEQQCNFCVSLTNRHSMCSAMMLLLTIWTVLILMQISKT